MSGARLRRLCMLILTTLQKHGPLLNHYLLVCLAQCMSFDRLHIVDLLFVSFLASMGGVGMLLHVGIVLGVAVPVVARVWLPFVQVAGN